LFGGATVRRSILFAVLILLLAEPAAAGTELLSIRLPQAKNQYINGFKVDTWGVEILAVCRIPVGWRITAGHYENSAGILSGEAKDGLSQPIAKAFTNLFLVEVHSYRARKEGSQPASFAGSVHVGPFGDTPAPHDVPLEASAFSRTPAQRCPKS
jgi:hypothetical protein